MKHDSTSHNPTTRTTSESSDAIGSSSSDLPSEYMKPAITENKLLCLQKL